MTTVVAAADVVGLVPGLDPGQFILGFIVHRDRLKPDKNKDIFTKLHLQYIFDKN